jgi:hypothetical protein
LGLRLGLIERRPVVAVIDLVEQVAVLDVSAVCRGLRLNI